MVILAVSAVNPALRPDRPGQREVNIILHKTLFAPRGPFSPDNVELLITKYRGRDAMWILHQGLVPFYGVSRESGYLFHGISPFAQLSAITGPSSSNATAKKSYIFPLSIPLRISQFIYLLPVPQISTGRGKIPISWHFAKLQLHLSPFRDFGDPTRAHLHRPSSHTCPFELSLPLFSFLGHISSFLTLVYHRPRPNLLRKGSSDVSIPKPTWL